MKVCLKCQKEFEPKRERAKFCSDICRASYHQSIKTAKRKLKFAGPSGKKAAEMFEAFLKEAKTIKYKKPTEESYDGEKINAETHDEPAQWQAPSKPKFRRTVKWYLDQADEPMSEADGMELIADARNEPFTRQEKSAIIIKISNGRYNS